MFKVFVPLLTYKCLKPKVQHQYKKKSVRTVNVYFTKNEGEGGEIEGYFSFSFRHHQYALYSTIDSYL
jgi:hypothetical protein